jgi:hypothetical protein
LWGCNVRENLRRPLLFLITVGTGSLIIVVDATIEVIVAGTVLAGFLALVVTGALDLAELKPSRLRSALRDRETKKEKPGVTTKKPSPTRNPSSAGINLPGMLGTLAASVRETIAHARAPEGERQNRTEKIDAMLDQAVDGAAPEQSITPVPPKAGRGVVADPLASLADLDLDSLEGLDLDGEASGPGKTFESDQFSLLSGEDADAISAILKTHQSDLDDLELASGIDLPGSSSEPATNLPSITADVPELPGGDGMPDMSVLSEELSALDDLDLDEIEVEGEEEEEEEVDTGDPIPGEEILEELEEETKEGFDMVSFASGGTVDDDLITELKSDAKKKKFVEDISLVRELKGERYHAKDLVVELEDVLATMKAQR